MKIKIKIIGIVVLAPLLTGCAHMNGQFDCPVGSGVSCQSMKTIDKMASQGVFAENFIHSSKRVIVSQRNTLSTQSPSRVSEQILKIWFAPFVDSQDNYHQANEIYTVLDKGFWQGNPVSSLTGASS